MAKPEKGHRVSIGPVEIGVVLVSMLVTSFLIFLLGVYVGKGLEEMRFAREENLVRLPVTGEASPPGGSAPVGAEGGREREHEVAKTIPPVKTPPPSVLAAPAPDVVGRKPLSASAREKGAWSVQVNASREKGTANALAAQLQQQGYDAYIIEVGRQGETWYRIRVGRFPSLERANAMATQLRRAGIKEAFVTSE